MQLNTNFRVVLRMAEFGLVEYFAIGEAVGIIGTLFVVFLLFKEANAKSFNRH